MSKKGRQFFIQEKIGVTPSVAALGVTHPSDATEYSPRVWRTQAANDVQNTVLHGVAWPTTGLQYDANYNFSVWNHMGIQ